MNLKKLKRLKPPPVPGQVKLLSLLAIVLVCAAPALVSVIDDTVNEQYDMPLSPDFDELKLYPNNMRFEGEPVTGVGDDFDIIGEDNVISILSPAIGYSGVFTISLMEKAIVKDVSKIVITTSEHGGMSIGSGNYFVPGIYDADLGQYTFTLSSIDKHHIMQSSSDFLSINAAKKFVDDRSFELVETYIIEVYGSVMIPYDEIIIGATGALLLICALLATPWFGTVKLEKGGRNHDS